MSRREESNVSLNFKIKLAKYFYIILKRERERIINLIVYHVAGSNSIGPSAIIERYNASTSR